MSETYCLAVRERPGSLELSSRGETTNNKWPSHQRARQCGKDTHTKWMAMAARKYAKVWVIERDEEGGERVSNAYALLPVHVPATGAK